MPSAIPREAKAFTFGLILGVGGSPYPPSDISRMVKERFGVDVSPKTVSNWKADPSGWMDKFGIGEDYVKEVIDRGLLGATKREGIPKETNREVVGNPSGEGDGGGEPSKKVNSLPSFDSLADVVGYMERQGFIVATNDQDLRDILDRNGLTLIEKGALRYGPEIISIEPIEMDFEIVGKQIAGNPVIMWYYGLARKLAALTGEKPPELYEYVTGCVVDAMVARKWNMAVLRA